MDEVERLCDRVAVFKRGRLIELDSPRGLVGRYARERTVRFSTDSSDLAWLSDLSCVRSVQREGADVAVLGDGPVLARVAAGLVARGLEPADLRVEIPTLEDAYMGLVEAE
jgi:ABC-2 type transport system ATP-binding protein